MIKSCHECRVDDALTALKELWDLGYSCHDIISTMFKVTKTIDSLSEQAKLEFIKVSSLSQSIRFIAVVDSIAGDWIHTYAHPRRRSDTSTALRLRCSTREDKYAAPAVRCCIEVIMEGMGDLHQHQQGVWRSLTFLSIFGRQGCTKVDCFIAQVK
jgi:hypothetical protein